MGHVTDKGNTISLLFSGTEWRPLEGAGCSCGACCTSAASTRVIFLSPCLDLLIRSWGPRFPLSGTYCVKIRVCSDGANLHIHIVDFSLFIYFLSSPFADTLEEFKEMNKGMWKKLQEKFAPRNPEEKQKAWARSLSRPRT